MPVRDRGKSGADQDQPVGVTGAGKIGNVGALAAIMNADVDAPSSPGFTHIDMPATPEQIWRAIRAARRA